MIVRTPSFPLETVTIISSLEAGEGAALAGSADVCGVGGL